MSFFHTASVSSLVPLLFGGGKWIVDNEFIDVPCQGGGTAHGKMNADYPLPQPPQNPITSLTGHGHEQIGGTCAQTYDFDDKYVRIGD
jgi:hypothetical protein